MATEIRDFPMENRASPLVARSHAVRLAKNGRLVAPGRYVKREGFTVTAAPTMQLGVTAPFRIFTWTVSGTTYRIACGSDALAFVNPFNNWLYVRDAASDRMYSAPTTEKATAWGLAAPAGLAALTRNSDFSSFAGGGYVYAISYFNHERNVESPGTFYVWSSYDHISLNDGYQAYVTVPAIASPATRARVYRTQLFTQSHATGWSAVFRNDYSGLRMFEEKSAAGAFYDKGNQAESRLFDYATTTVPKCLIHTYFDGRHWYGTGFTLYFSNPACPETYPGEPTSVVAEVQGGIHQAKGEIQIPPECGTITGLVAFGGTLMVLCQYGSWRLVAMDVPGFYSVSYDNLFVGCVSQATIARSPVGLWWLAREGVVWWDGQGPPVVLGSYVIDPEDSDTAFASDMTTACGAYDLKNREYVCVVPKSGGGQFALAVRGDRVPGEIAVSMWTFHANLGTVTGMGYDAVTNTLVLAVGTTTVATWTQNGAYYDGTVNTNTFPLVIELVWGMGERITPEKPAIKQRPMAHVLIHRASAGQEQTVTWAIQGMRTTEESSGDSTTSTLVWASSAVGSRAIAPQDIAGRMFRFTFTNTDRYNLEYRGVLVGVAEDLMDAVGIQ